MGENTSIKFEYLFSINKAQYTSLLIQTLLKQNKILEEKKKQKNIIFLLLLKHYYLNKCLAFLRGSHVHCNIPYR